MASSDGLVTYLLAFLKPRYFFRENQRVKGSSPTFGANFKTVDLQ